jgi:hypothetical protein
MNFETHQQRDAMMCFTSAATCAVLRNAQIAAAVAAAAAAASALCFLRTACGSLEKLTAHTVAVVHYASAYPHECSFTQVLKQHSTQYAA